MITVDESPRLFVLQDTGEEKAREESRFPLAAILMTINLKLTGASLVAQW